MSRAGRATALAAIALAHALALTFPFARPQSRDWAALALLYLGASFAVAVGLHRYFAHRAFQTSRAFQLGMGLAASCFFGDPVGFAGKHRLHHRHADTERDPHSPRQGIWRCWVGHLLADGHPESAILAAVPDLVTYPELRFLHRFYFLPGSLLAASLLIFGGYTMVAAYAFNWCVLVIQGPALVNYFCHRGRSRPFDTPDASSNNWLLGALLFGEGWHNNHHRFPGAAHAGLRWYEVDGAYYMLKVLSWLGLVWDLRVVPPPRAVFSGEEPCASR